MRRGLSSYLWGWSPVPGWEEGWVPTFEDGVQCQDEKRAEFLSLRMESILKGRNSALSSSPHWTPSSKVGTQPSSQHGTGIHPQLRYFIYCFFPVQLTKNCCWLSSTSNLYRIYDLFIQFTLLELYRFLLIRLNLFFLAGFPIFVLQKYIFFSQTILVLTFLIIF